jgi:hypothetical protein
MAPLSTAGNHPLFRATSEGPGVLPILTSHHVLKASRAQSPYPPLFSLCRQYVYTIRDDRRGLFDALIYLLRFSRFLRNGLGVKTSDWRGRWLHQVKDAHGQSKSSSKLPSLCSTQPHIKGFLDNPLPTSMERTTSMPGDPVSHHTTV